MEISGALLSLGLAGWKASTQYAQGKLERAEAEYNAKLYDQKAQVIEVQKDIEFRQYEKLKRSYRGEVIASTAASGLAFTGSPISVLSSSLANIEMDKQIGQYNLEVEKRFTQSQAEGIRIGGRIKQKTASMNAFSTMLSGGFDYGMSQGWIKVK
jgi:hypothetical protein